MTYSGLCHVLLRCRQIIYFGSIKPFLQNAFLCRMLFKSCITSIMDGVQGFLGEGALLSIGLTTCFIYKNTLDLQGTVHVKVAAFKHNIKLYK